MSIWVPNPCRVCVCVTLYQDGCVCLRSSERVHYPIIVKWIGTIKWEAGPSPQEIEAFCGTYLSQDLMNRRHLGRRTQRRENISRGKTLQCKPKLAFFILLGFGNWSASAFFVFFFKPPFLLAYFSLFLKNSLCTILLTFYYSYIMVIYPLQVYLLLSSSSSSEITVLLFPTCPSFCLQ